MLCGLLAHYKHFSCIESYEGEVEDSVFMNSVNQFSNRGVIRKLWSEMLCQCEPSSCHNWYHNISLGRYILVEYTSWHQKCSS